MKQYMKYCFKLVTIFETDRSWNRILKMKAISLSAIFIGFAFAAETLDLNQDANVVLNNNGDVVDVVPPTFTNSTANVDPSVGKAKHKQKHKKAKIKINLQNNKETDDLEKLADKLMNDFTVKFNEGKDDVSKSTTTASMEDERSKTKRKSRDIDRKIKKWSKKVFSRPHKRRRDKKGKPVKYYKDSSIPVMFRKVIPPSGQPLPMLHFKYKENGKLCKCKCKV